MPKVKAMENGYSHSARDFRWRARHLSTALARPSDVFAPGAEAHRWLVFAGFLSLGIVLIWFAMGCSSGAGGLDGGGDSSPVMPPLAKTTPVGEVSFPAQAWIDRTLNLAFYNDEQLQDIAASPMAAFQMRLLLSPEAQVPIAKIRAANPDIVVLGILGTQVYFNSWSGEQHRQRFPLGAALYDLFQGHEAYRTDGVMATKWVDAPMVNPWRAGMSYNRPLMLRQVDVIARYATIFSGAMDGIFHDNVSINAWLTPQPEDPETQQADFDGDGVGIREDDDDLTAWQQWQVGYVEELQSRFGEGFVQVANGDRPLRRPEFTALFAGVVLEDFPHTVWDYTYLESMDLIAHIQEDGLLTPRRGRTWSLLWDNYRRTPDFTRTASMLTDAFYALDETREWIANDPQARLAGTIAGPLVRTVQGDGSVLFERQMQAGKAWAQMAVTEAVNGYGLLP